MKLSNSCALFGMLALDVVTVHGWVNNNLHQHDASDILMDSRLDRRNFLQGITLGSLLISSTTITTSPLPANAASLPSPAELERVRKGQARVRYLLDNWDSITQVCGTTVMSDAQRKQVVRTEGSGAGGCEKTPLNVQDYMGYKSTEDPLYRIDKLLVRAAQLIDDPDEFERYLETVEKYKEKADNSAMMAYTSSWGEANPNGGKDVIEEYLERTKLDVVDSERYLSEILTYLKLDPLKPSKNP